MSEECFCRRGKLRATSEKHLAFAARKVVFSECKTRVLADVKIALVRFGRKCDVENVSRGGLLRFPLDFAFVFGMKRNRGFVFVAARGAWRGIGG